VEKVHDVVGLYLYPPDNALVLSVDEKSQIQALDRTQPILPLGLGYLEDVIRIRHKIHEIPGLGALLSEVMRRLCVVRSEGVPPAFARNRVTCKKANTYYTNALSDK